jgi:hypothetical protein
VTNIETKEIKGITLKGIITLIICTASIVGTTLFNYFSLQGDIRSIREQQINTDRYWELRLQSVELNIGIIERKANRKTEDMIKESVTETLNQLKNKSP